MIFSSVRICKALMSVKFFRIIRENVKKKLSEKEKNNRKMSIQGISLQVERPNLSADPANQMLTFRQYLNILGDSQAKDENKLKAAQELNDSFDVIIAHQQYQTFLDHAMRVFLKLLQVSLAQILLV